MIKRFLCVVSLKYIYKQLSFSHTCVFHGCAGTEAYDLEKCLGKGMYGTVFKAVNLQTGETVALKTQKPAWVWEYYIVREIKARLTNPHMVSCNIRISYC